MADDRPPDLEGQLFRGCATIFGISIVSFFIGSWPFMIGAPLTSGDLWTNWLIGPLVQLVLTVIFAFLMKNEGAIGGMAGGWAAALFIWLRLYQLPTTQTLNRTAEVTWGWTDALAIVLAYAGIAAVIGFGAIIWHSTRRTASD